jgi:ribosomal subunit interface protein
MKINIKATNIHLTPEISDYLQKKLDMLDRMIDPSDTSVFCEVEVGKTTNHHKTGDVFRTEINLTKDGKLFRAVSEESTVNASIDEAKDEILGELKHHKSKRVTLMRRGGAQIKNLIKGVGSYRPWRRRRQ